VDIVPVERIKKKLKKAEEQKLRLYLDKVYTTDLTHALHSLSYHSVTTMADDEIELMTAVMLLKLTHYETPQRGENSVN